MGVFAKRMGDFARTNLGFDWNNLQAFLAVARYGRLTVAASRTGMDHSTVARHIGNLETSLRSTLFDRGPTGYSLTALGERLLPIAEQIELLTLKAQDVVGRADHAVQGSVRIGAPEGFGSYYLAPRLMRLGVQYPDLRIQLVAGSSLFSVAKRDADIAIALSAPAKGRLFAKRLTDYSLSLYASRDYLAQTSEIRRQEDLSGHRFIGYIDDLLNAPELDYLKQINPEISTALESSNLVAQLQAAKSGAGLCVLPAFIAEHLAGLVPVLPDEVRLTRSLWMVIHADTRHLARVRTAAKFIEDIVSEERALFSAPLASH
ncbi:LysR family transcriptional regulator [Sphingobium sp. EM0848]|uniref:LysR family transcriptional regulator n=1 Tax=Sphingobium sp. EM0848 TaxID=2743473 RepID=UPI001C3F71EE|nr:LysR family transcriptional regulator [Sphingobium sp. EM0848]